MNRVDQEFSGLAAGYETNRLAGWYKAHAVEILDHCPALERGDILDVGCGTGYLLRSFLKLNPGAGGIGVDIAPGMIDQAERLARADAVNNVQFVCADWETLDTATLRERSIRIAVCANTLHYFSSPLRAMKKLLEVLDEDGVLYLLERDKSNSPLTHIWGWLHRHCIKDHVEFYTRQDLVSILKKAGGRDIAIVRSINRLLWKNKLYTSIVLVKCMKDS